MAATTFRSMPDQTVAMPSTYPGDISVQAQNGAVRPDPARNRKPTPAMPAQPISQRFAPELALLLVVIFWSSTFVIAKAAFAEISALAFVFVRFLIMLALAFAVLLIRQRGASRLVDRADWGRFALVGLTGYTFYHLGFTLGLDRTSPFSSSLLIATVPLFTVLILAFMGEPTPLQIWLGLAVALAGVVVFLLDKRDASAGTLVGDLLSIGAAISFAIYGIISRPLVRKYPAATYAAWSLLAGTIPLLLVALPDALRQNWQAVSAPAWLSIVYLAIFPVYVAYILWNWAISRRGVAAVSSFGLLVPIAAGVLSAVFYGEPFGPWKLLGAALVLAGLVVVRMRPWRPGIETKGSHA
jgi:drug/metabolite transporter (DMT)-like permease